MIAHYPKSDGGLLATVGRAVAQWRIVLVWLVLILVPTAVVTLPMGRFFARELDHSIYAIEWARQLNVVALIDLLARGFVAIPFVGGTGLLAMLLTVLLSPLLTGVVVTWIRMDRTLGFVALLSGGVAEYGRVLRMSIWSIVPFGLVIALFAAVTNWIGQRDEEAIVSSGIVMQSIASWIGFALLLGLVQLTLEAGRAQFVLDTARRSAIRAWWRGVRLVIARPLASIGTYAVVTLLGLGLAGLLGLARINLPHAALPGFLVAFVLAELIAASLIWMRIARLLVLVQIARQQLALSEARGRTLH